jgi:ABC-type cobalamin/Fe3+-siderophores transport system ATPase subunit
MKKMVLEINDLSIGFKKVIFEKINAKMEEGSITALMGINGAGKSCLLKTIANLISSLHGSIKINGLDQKEFSEIDFAKTVSLVSLWDDLLILIG